MKINLYKKAGFIDIRNGKLISSFDSIYPDCIFYHRILFLEDFIIEKIRVHYYMDLVQCEIPPMEKKILSLGNSESSLDYLSRLERFQSIFTVQGIAIYWTISPLVAYAIHCKKRFTKGEPVILESPRASLDYAIEVIRGRWPEFEEKYHSRNKNPHVKKYCKIFNAEL